LDIRIRLQTHYPAGYPTGKPYSDHLCNTVIGSMQKLLFTYLFVYEQTQRP